jgi:hypothetical protein
MGRLSTWAGGRRFRSLIKHELTAFSAVGYIHLVQANVGVRQSVCLNHTTMSFQDTIIVPERSIEFELERTENSQSGGRSETRTRMLVLNFFRVGIRCI